MNKLVRLFIKYSRIGVIKRYFKYKEFTNMLNINGGFVYDVHHLKIENGKLYATGEDPNVSIKFFKVTNVVEMEYKIDLENDSIEMFYIPVQLKNASFSPMWVKNVGKGDNEKHHQVLAFYDKTRNIRIDFGSKHREINISSISIVNKTEILNDADFSNVVLNSVEVVKDDKNVVIVTHAFSNTGAPILALNMAKKFKERDYKVVVLSLLGGELEERFLEYNIPVITLSQGSYNNQIADMDSLDCIVKNLSEKGYTNCITNTIISGLTVPAFKKYNFKVTSLIHEMRHSIELYDMRQGGENINVYSDRIVFPAEIVKNGFYSIFNKSNDNAVICPQGLYKTPSLINNDYESIYEEFNIPSGSKIIIGSGTADFRKGIDLFILAAQQMINIEKADEEFHFIWTGKIIDEDYEKWIKCQLENQKLENRFHIISFVKDKDKYQNLISCADVFWLTSREDPYPSVMIEALQYGTPVVAFMECGGADDLLSEGRGTLVPNFNLQKYVDETIKLINNPNLVSKQIELSRDFIKKKLNFDKYIDYLEDSFVDKEEKVKYADLSVIVPNYNYEDYISIRLNSIINQTIKPKEIIFLDDVSSDNSVKIAEEILKDAKKKYNIDYRIVVNEKNNGCFNQWLKGIKEAKYEYLWIAEADDYAQGIFVETLMKGFDNPKVVLSYAQSKVIDEYGTASLYKYTDYTSDFSTTKWEKSFVDDGKKQVINYFTEKNIIPNVSSTIIKKSATEGLDKELSKYSVIGDWLAYIYILNNGSVNYDYKTLNCHRRHSKSIISKKEKTREFIYELLKIKLYIINNLDLNDAEINKLMTSIQNFDYYRTLIESDEELKSMFSELLYIAKQKRKKDNILIIIPDLEVGGGQSVGIRIANSMVKYYNVFVINARSWLETDMMKNMIDDKVVLLDNNSAEDLKNYYSCLKFKSVISLIWWSDKLSYQALSQTDAKLILSMHGDYEMLLHNRDVDSYFNDNYIDMMNRFNKIVYTAEKNKEILQVTNLLDNPKVSKIDNGFIIGNHSKKSREQLNIKDDDFVFGLVARAIPDKGYEEAIKALIKVNDNSKKKAHLILVGASEYVNNLKEKYKDSHIHFIDKFSEPNEWLGWEEIFNVGLLPSYFKSESLPTVIVENLFLGNPFIATDIAEIKSMLIDEDSKAGDVVPLKDGKADVDKLADAMDKIMNDKDYYNMLKSNTKKFANRFDMDKCINKYRELIEDDKDE